MGKKRKSNKKFCFTAKLRLDGSSCSAHVSLRSCLSRMNHLYQSNLNQHSRPVCPWLTSNQPDPFRSPLSSIRYMLLGARKRPDVDYNLKSFTRARSSLHYQIMSSQGSCSDPTHSEMCLITVYLDLSSHFSRVGLQPSI